MSTVALGSEAISPSALGVAERDAMFALMAESYEHVARDRFEADLDAKDTVLLLREKKTGVIRGFSTQTVFQCAPRGRRERAIFSGDTIIAASHRGTQELVRAWFRYAGRVLAAEPETPLHWLLISKGYRTYLYLPIFFTTYQPHDSLEATPEDRDLMDTLAKTRFGSAYDRAAGVIRFNGRLGNLTENLAKTPASRSDDPKVAYFLKRNPGYTVGEELVCVARISPENTRGMARSLLLEGMATALTRGGSS